MDSVITTVTLMIGSAYLVFSVLLAFWLFKIKALNSIKGYGTLLVITLSYAYIKNSLFMKKHGPEASISLFDNTIALYLPIVELIIMLLMVTVILTMVTRPLSKKVIHNYINEIMPDKQKDLIIKSIVTTVEINQPLFTQTLNELNIDIDSLPTDDNRYLCAAFAWGLGFYNQNGHGKLDDIAEATFEAAHSLNSLKLDHYNKELKTTYIAVFTESAEQGKTLYSE